MADNTRVNELQDKLLKAIDILNAQALNSISFDKTITCKIENDKDKKEGKYEVNDGNRIFTAYSTDTKYRTGDTVYVTVPEGKFENQKMIIGKKTAENDKPFNFTQPFDTFFDMTGNLAVGATAIEAVANNEGDKRIAILCQKDEQGKPVTDENNNIIPLNVEDKDIIKYTRLAIRANFRSWIKNAVSGNYGIDIILTTEKPNITTGESKNGTYTYRFDSSMFYGNPYNFETYYSQELVLDLEKRDIGKVTGIRVDFYQDEPFKDKEDVTLSSTEQDGILLAPNLFVDNLEIYFGKDISTFTSDMVEIYTANSDSYKRSTSTDLDIAQKEIEANKKVIKIRWVHLKDGVPVDMNIEKNQKDIQYEIRWYRYRVGVAAADEYCGVYWDYVDNTNISEDGFIYTLNPDVNKQQEYIKAIVLCNNIPYHSNELIFKNEEELPPSKEAQYIANALNIECKDGSYGNYLLYGQGTKIKDDSLANQDRELVCYFDADNNGEHESEITDNNKITWIFPKKNTMINVIEQEGKTEKNDDTQIIVKNAKPKYRILGNYNSNYSNNTIQCIYELNEVIYSTEIEFTFGKAGTMGSDQTLIIDFVGDQKAYEIDQVKVEFKLRVTDHLGADQDLSNADIKWKWYYNNEDNSSQDIIGTGPILSFEEPKWSIDKLHILEASVGQLTTYFSIPIKENIENTNCAYISGATEVVYQSDGIADYSKQPYQIYDKEGKIISGVNWEIILPEEAYSYTYHGKISEFKDNTYYSKEELQDGDGKFTGYTYNLITSDNWNSSTPYYIKIVDNYIGQINKDTNVLEPVNLYVKDAPIYGIRAILSGKTIWSQPIFVCQNKWPSTVINQWDGKSLQLDEEKSAVIAAAVSAGKKNSDNTFSGVMIGDWSGKDLDTGKEIANQTGVYGFHHGAMSYAFKEDGTAFIGKYGRGRIYIDGNNSTLYSNGWKNDLSVRGMQIDLDAPYIKMTDGTNDIIIDATKSGSTTSTNSTYAPFQIGTKFRVAWNGSIYAQDGYFDGTLYSEEGQIGGWYIDENTLSSEDGKVILDSSGSITGATINGGSINGAIITAETIYVGASEAYYYKIYKKINNIWTYQETKAYDAYKGSVVYDGDMKYVYSGFGEETEMAQIGKFSGQDDFDNNTTIVVGMTTTEVPMVFETSKNMRLSTKADFYLDCPANKQHGIYARFA